MANVITRRVRLSRRFFLKGLTASHAPVVLGLPPLVCMFNSNGTAYAAGTKTNKTAPIDKRFVLWFNGNGIPERYWIPGEEGPEVDVDITREQETHGVDLAVSAGQVERVGNDLA